jgi:hypothetical protein
MDIRDIIKKIEMHFNKNIESVIIDLSKLSNTIDTIDINGLNITIYNNDNVNDKNTIYIPVNIQQEFHKKYGSIISIDIYDEEYFQKLVLYFFLQLNVYKIISDISAEDFIYKDDIINRNKKLILIGNALKPDEITVLLSKNKNNYIQKNNKSLIIFIIDDIWQLIYFSKRFNEMYEDGIFNYEINIIIIENNKNTNNDFYDLSPTIFKLINKILSPNLTIGLKVFGTKLKNITKCFFSLLSFYNTNNKTNEDNYFKQYEYVIKIDTSIEKHNIREKQLCKIFNEQHLSNYNYNYTNHAYVCYLLNILGLKNIFQEQNMEFSKRKYENIERCNINININKYYKIKTNLINKNKLWIINNELNDDENINTKYMSMSEASIQLLDLLSSLDSL